MAAEQGGCWYVVSWVAAAKPLGARGLSLILFSTHGMHSPIPLCAQVNLCSVHHTSRTNPAENKPFSQVSSLQQIQLSAPAHTTATLALVLAQEGDKIDVKCFRHREKTSAFSGSQSTKHQLTVTT